jgi:hypothetical protein
MKRIDFILLMLSPLIAPFLPKKEITTLKYPNGSKVLFDKKVAEASEACAPYFNNVQQLADDMARESWYNTFWNHYEDEALQERFESGLLNGGGIIEVKRS